MSTMSKNQTTGRYELNITPSPTTQTQTLKVGGNYCDTDIDVIVSAMTPGSITPTFGDAGLSTYFNSGSSSDYSVAIRGGYTSTAGYITTNSSAQYGSYSYYKIKSATFGTDNSGTNQITVTPTNATQYVNITAGWVEASKITISGINAILTVNGDSPDANGNVQISQTGATTSDTMPNTLVESGNFLKLIKVRA